MSSTISLGGVWGEIFLAEVLMKTLHLDKNIATLCRCAHTRKQAKRNKELADRFWLMPAGSQVKFREARSLEARFA